MKKPYKICMISCLHGLYDDRIYWKEALSLKKHGYEVVHVGVGKQDRQFVSEHGIQMIEVEKKQYFANPFIDKIFRTITFRENIYHKIYKKILQNESDIYHIHDLQILKIIKQIKRFGWNPKIIYCPRESFPDMIRDYIKTRTYDCI